jgi:predicted NAD-dependent protein-ADP-ribosyltransferase YbiA (DUF1768 family)
MILEPMSEQDIENMNVCIRLKIEQHATIKQMLLATGNRNIYEDVSKRNGSRHLFWGAKRNNGYWEGNNMLGKIWMELRSQL